MKQYVYNVADKKEGSAFPLLYNLKQAVGALTLHAGVGTSILCMGIKNARNIIYGEPTRLFRL